MFEVVILRLVRAAQLINHFTAKEREKNTLPCIPLTDHERAEQFWNFGKGQDILLQAIKKRPETPSSNASCRLLSAMPVLLGSMSS